MQQSLFAVAVAEAPKATGGWDEVLKLSLEKAVFTVIDTETTGLNPKKSDLIEITAIKYQNGADIGMFSTLIKPSIPITEESSIINGITNDMVQDAPPLVTVLSDLSGFVGGDSILVGHNVAFDIGFLREKLDQSGLSVLLPRYDLAGSLCTKVLARKIMPGLPSYEGVQLAGHMGIYNPNAHRAEADVRMCADILFGLLKRSESPFITIQDLMAYHGPLS